MILNRENVMKTIGLTGGIGTGKSTVSSYLALQKGAVIIDADLIARDITEKGKPAIKKLVDTFGRSILTESGQLDRKRLGEMVFNDPEKLEQLDGIMLNAIIDEVKRQVGEAAEYGTKYAVVDAPLLFEVGFDQYVDEVWVVDASLQTRIDRIVERDGISKELADKKIRSQMSSNEKIRRADHVINNSGDVKYLYEQVDRLI